MLKVGRIVDACMDADQEDKPAGRKEPSEISEFRKVVVFLDDQVTRGEIADEHFDELFVSLLAPIYKQGYLDMPLEELKQLAPEQQAAIRGVVRHAVHCVRQQLVLKYPQLAKELDQVLSSQHPGLPR
jgi:hypothetical protein